MSFQQLCRLFIGMAILGSVPTLALGATPLADWTVMVFMNANNNLEPWAFQNFTQMAKVGSSDSVNVVVEFARIGKYSRTTPQWTNTLRFRVKSGTNPVPQEAVQDMGKSVDMGDPQSLADFLSWASTQYPAKHYFLVMWDHGQGYRAEALDGSRAAFVGVPTAAPYRTISNDDVHGTKLYMRDVEDTLAAFNSSVARQGAKLDVVGFDACLMSMVETAYALRNVAHVMVGSQELEPGKGWWYDDLLKRLVDKPTMDDHGVGVAVVESFRTIYGNPTSPSADPNTTMSATDLDKIPELTSAIDGFSKELAGSLATDRSHITTARMQCPQYAPDPFGTGVDYFFHIDLGCFAKNVANVSTSSSVRAAAVKVTNSLKASIIDDYAGQNRVAFGSNGLCIYFPASAADYKNDAYAENGYEKTNTSHPVEFVQQLHWTDFLHSYLKL